LAPLAALACGDDTGEGGAGGEGGSTTSAKSTSSTGSPSSTASTTNTSTTTSTTSTTSTGMEVCGDGDVGPNEACDDNNTADGDGCDASCEVEAGYVCDGSPSVCMTDCGDGIIAGAEECDDQNDLDDDGCDMLCVVELGYDCTGMPSVCTATCGDGVIAVGTEECDDNNTTTGDGCADDCQIDAGYSCMGEPSVCMTNCGDGVVAGTEECDDMNAVNDDGCSDACAEESGWDCTGNPSVCATTCGDDIVAGTETCDDANTANGDCCSSSCAVEAGCETEPNNSDATADDFAMHQVGGQVCGFVDPDGDANYYSVTLAAAGTITAETLDGVLGTTCVSNGNDTRIRIFDATQMQLVSDDDGGAGFCSLATTGLLMPGTYYVVVDESPLGSTPTFDYCLEVTTDAAVCGDGDLDPGETCDDGNLNSGDGCSSTCQVECNNETEANDTSATADALNLGTLNCGAVNPGSDIDFWTFTTTATTTDVRIETFDATGATCTGGIDTVIELRAPNGTTILVTDDEDGINSCSLVAPANDVGARQIPPGTYFVRVIDFQSNTVIPAYRVGLSFTAVCGNAATEGFEECDGGPNCNADCTRVPVCGDGFIDAPETCDDNNTTNGDGCSSTCQLENLLIESEPNDDGMTATATNDFNAAAADGPISSSTVVQAAIGVAGDDDVFAITNPTASAIVVTAETFTDIAGTACTGGITTDIKVRDMAGTQLAVSQTEGLNSCSHLSYLLNPGQTLYLHVVEAGDNAAIASYFMHVTFLSPLGTQAEVEPNEDGTPQTGGSGTIGNDFDAVAVTNATAQGVVTADRLFTAAIPVAGDEDVYAVTNSGATNVTIDVETYTGTALGTCTADTGMHIRNATGTSLASSDDEGIGACSYIDNFTLTPGQTVYVHVVEFGDNGTIASYQLLVTVN